MLAVFRAQSDQGRLAFVTCWFILIALAGVQWLRIGAAPHSMSNLPVWAEIARAVFATAVIPVFMRLQLSLCRRGEALRSPRLAWTIILFAAAFEVAGIPGMSGTVMLSTIVLAFRPRYAALGAALCVVWTGFQAVRLGLTGGPVAMVLELAFLTMLLVAATKVAIQFDNLALAREALVRRQVDRERQRIGRDLHDLMGRTLVAASLRTQTALRTLEGRDPDSAGRLMRLHETISRGQAQLRSLTSGPAITTLGDELEGARTLCERVKVDFEVFVDDEPPAELDTAFGVLVREAVTHVLQHQRATTCTLRITRHDSDAVLSVVTTHTPTSAARDAHDERLRQAVDVIGGEFSHTAEGPEATRLTFTVPVDDAAISQELKA